MLPKLAEGWLRQCGDVFDFKDLDQESPRLLLNIDTDILDKAPINMAAEKQVGRINHELKVRGSKGLKAASSSNVKTQLWARRARFNHSERTEKYQTKQKSLWNLGSTNKTNSPAPELPRKRLKNWRLTNARITTYRNWKTWGVCFSTWSWSVCGERRSHTKEERHSFISRSAICMWQLSISSKIERHFSA